MDTVESTIPALALSCPLIASFLILLSRGRPNVRESWSLLAGIGQFLLILSMKPLLLQGKTVSCNLLTGVLPGIDLGLRVDALGLVFAITSSFLYILVSAFSVGYMRALEEHGQTRYYFCFALAIFGAVGVALSKNLLTFFLFYEILTVSTYPLVAHEESQEALFAGRKYLAYLLTSGVFLLAATALDYSLAGTTDFRPGGHLSPATASKPLLTTLFFLFLLGLMKAAYMPFHSWLPTAMVAPTPVSALLHAVAVVKAGVFGVLRVVCHVYGTDLMKELGLGTMLAALAGFTMIGASLFAIAQDNLKKRLAYSTISQLSYILFGAGLLTPMGLTGAILHIPFHGFMKITLFLCAGFILAATGKKDISEMAGIGRAMPITMFAFTIGALGMCGAPPVAGLLTKWYLGLGAVQSGSLPFLAILLIASLLDVVYFFPLIRTAFFEAMPREEILPGDLAKGVEILSERPLPIETARRLYAFMFLPLSVTGLCSILFCLFPNLFDILNLARIAVRGVL
ncbi:MAG: monovalent cation/H+ antiporter subunit D family protein [Desulfobacterota bacterium]|nr:monovalent cation/H+ antiporter subunit D family protein [Thermodesulfobacteriota bacterium]